MSEILGEDRNIPDSLTPSSDKAFKGSEQDQDERGETQEEGLGGQVLIHNDHVEDNVKENNEKVQEGEADQPQRRMGDKENEGAGKDHERRQNVSEKPKSGIKSKRNSLKNQGEQLPPNTKSPVPSVHSYHDSDSEIIDFDFEDGRIIQDNQSDISAADSWDWTFPDENVSDLAVDRGAKHLTKRRLKPRSKGGDSSGRNKDKAARHSKETSIKSTSPRLPIIDMPPKENVERGITSHGDALQKIIAKFKKPFQRHWDATNQRNPILSDTEEVTDTPQKHVHLQEPPIMHVDFKKKDNIVYFEGSSSSQVIKAKLMYLNDDADVQTQMTNTYRGFKGVSPRNSRKKANSRSLRKTNSKRQFERRNVKRTLTKLNDVEAKFMSPLRQYWMSPVTEFQNNLNPHDNNYGSTLSLSTSLAKSENQLPSLNATGTMTSTMNSTLRRKPSLVLNESVNEALTAWRLTKGRGMSLSTQRKSLTRDEMQKDADNLNGVLSETQEPEESISPLPPPLTPLEKFIKAGRTIILLLRAVGLKPEKPMDTHYNFLSWTVVYDEVLGISRMNYDKGALTFDPQLYKANKESTVSQDIKDILRLPPEERTDAQIRSAVISLHNAVPSFAEFPLKVQRSMLKVCRYEIFEPGRVIMRQGQRAENFYFILAGCAVVTEMDSGANHVTTANVLGKGNSFGELAFLNLSKRSATVTCREDVEVICIEREDFINIFMKGVKGKEPDHVAFLRNVDLLKGWPIDVLPYDNPNIFAFTYVRRGVILCHDSAKCEWLFVVVSGSCKVLKALDDGPARKLSSKQPRPPSVTMSPTNSSFSQIYTTDPVNNSINHNSDQSLQRHTRARRYGQVSSAPSLAQANRKMLKDKKLHDSLLSQIEHLAEINEIYYQKHVLPSIKKGEESEESTPRKTSNQRLQAAQNTRLFRPKRQSYGLQPPALPHVEEAARAQSEARRHPNEKVFIELTRLEPGSVFGLEHIVLKGMRDVTSCSLVSDGAEVVLISKKFFQKHLTEETMKEIRRKIRPLPSEKALQKNYETKKTWDVYKANTLAQHSSRRDRLSASLQTG